MLQLSELWIPLHLIGLSLALGSVFIADLRTLKCLLEPTHKMRTILPFLDILHFTINAGLALLIVSGVAILFDRFDALSELPGKVWWKSILVAMLFANSFYINKRVMPFFKEQVNTLHPDRILITGFNSKARLKFAFSSSISTLGWAGAFLMGSIKAFKTMSCIEIAPVLFMIWLLAFFFTLGLLDSIAAYAKKLSRKTESAESRESAQSVDLVSSQQHSKIQATYSHQSQLQQNRPKRKQRQQVARERTVSLTMPDMPEMDLGTCALFL